VIGVALFRERRAARPPPIPYPMPRPWNERGDEPRPYGSAVPQEPGAAGESAARSADSFAPQAQGGEMYRREKNLGTGHGRQEQSQTRYTDFQRASSAPDQVITIYYDTYSNLVAMGVPVYRDDRWYSWRKREPRPFPREPQYGFVPDPR